jgi:hypothetical protein
MKLAQVPHRDRLQILVGGTGPDHLKIELIRKVNFRQRRAEVLQVLQDVGRGGACFKAWAPAFVRLGHKVSWCLVLIPSAAWPTVR